MKLDKAEQQWELLLLKASMDLDIDLKNATREIALFIKGTKFVESNLSQVPKVRQLLDDLENALNLEIDDGIGTEIYKALEKFKETK